MSAIWPSHAKTGTLLSALQSEKTSILATIKSGEYDTDEPEHHDLVYQLRAIEECTYLVNGLRWQDADKKTTGLIVYIGYTENPNETKATPEEPAGGQKIVHTFPCPCDAPGLSDPEVVFGTRFDLSMMNRNKWYTDVLGEVK